MNPLIWTPGTQYEVGDIVYDNDEILVKTGVFPNQSDDWEIINPQGPQGTLGVMDDHDLDYEYDGVYKNMSDLLKEKGLPDMDKLLEIARENNPELFI